MKISSKKSILVLLLIAPLICINYSFIQYKNNSAIMKYKLNEKCKDFINEIEKLYNCEIKIIEKKLNNSEHGWSKIENDTPIIEINTVDKYKDAILIHEAYHLKLRHTGFPNISFEFSKNSNSDNNKVYLKWFSHLFWDKISHYYFYPLMLNELRINPYKSLPNELRETYKNGKIEGLSDATIHIALAGYYLQVWIETQNEKELKKFKNFLIENYNGQGIEQGESLISIFKTNQIKNSNDALELFIICFNLFHANQNIYISSPIIEKELHKNYVQYYANFKLGSI